MKLIPGMNKIDDGMLKQGEEQLKKIEAMISSMTEAERRDPDPEWAMLVEETLGQLLLEARNLLRLARTRFAEVRPWTADLVDEQYSPRIKLIAALRGG